MKITHPLLILQQLLFIVLLVILPEIAYPQEAGSCAEKLKNAESLFDRGQVDQVPSMIGECMKAGFNREESLAAYKLLIQAYLFEEKLELADSTMMTFLKKNPEYKVSPTDHSSFVHLFNNFDVKPVVQITFHFGTNVPFLTFLNTFSSASETCKNGYSRKALNLFTSIEARFEISKRLELNFEAGYSSFSFTNSEDFMGFKKTTYTETQNRIEMPATITYDILTFGKFTTYGRLGQGVAITLNSSAKPFYVPVDLNNTNSFSGADISRADSRIKTDLFTQLGAGLKFKISRGFVFMEIRANLGLFNQTVRGGSSSEELRWLYNYEDDDFHLNSLNVSIGISQIFYKPSKRKE